MPPFLFDQQPSHQQLVTQATFKTGRHDGEDRTITTCRSDSPALLFHQPFVPVVVVVFDVSIKVRHHSVLVLVTHAA
jgi:hypothetical protein